MNEKQMFITTVDNPYNPFTQFEDWFKYDFEEKYYTCSYIDRIVHKNNPKLFEYSDSQYDEAMKEIVEFNPELYKIVFNN